MAFDPVGAGGLLRPDDQKMQDEKKLEEEFFKFMAESELMDDILEDDESE